MIEAPLIQRSPGRPDLLIVPGGEGSRQANPGRGARYRQADRVGQRAVLPFRDALQDHTGA